MVPAGAGAWFHQGVEWPVGAGEPVHQRVEVVPVVHQDRLGSVQLHLFPGHPERLDRGGRLPVPGSRTSWVPTYWCRRACAGSAAAPTPVAIARNPGR